MADERTRGYWQTRAGSLAFRVNAATWFERVAPILFFAACAFAVSIYAFRRIELPLVSVWIGLVTAVGAIGGWTGWRSRPSYFSMEDARVLLESRLRLETRLTAATTGLVGWPAAPNRLPNVVRWQPRVPVSWIAGALGLVALALIIPVPGGSIDAAFRGPPPSLAETRELLAELKEMKVADEQALERLEEKLNELEKKSAEEQYKHSALEAADALKNQVASAKANLTNGLDSASSALRDANEGANLKETASRLSESIAGMSTGALPADPSLLGQIPATAVDLGALSAAQREALAAALQKAGSGNGNGQGQGQGQGKGKGKGKGKGSGGDGDGEGEGDGPPTDKSGQGSGLGRGGGPAELKYGDKHDAGEGRLETMEKSDLSTAKLGDQLGTSSSAPQFDATKIEGPSAGGTVTAPAQGGEAVWTNQLKPAERSALKSFFK